MPDITDDQAEKSLLGSILRRPDILDDVVQIIRPIHFRHPWHTWVYESMLRLQGLKPIDLVTVADDLTINGHIREIGYDTLADLFQTEPTGAKAIYYAQIVRDNWLRRELGRLGERLATEAQSPSQTPQDTLKTLEVAIREMAEGQAEGEITTVSQEIPLTFDRLDKRWSRDTDLTGVPSGLPDLDELTCGWQPGELILIAARPSVGKTAFALHLARHAALVEGVSVFFASLEQSRSELMERLLCCQARLDSHAVRHGRLTDQDIEALRQAGRALQTAKLSLDDRGTQNLLRIGACARRVQRQHGLGLVLIDYLQLIDPDTKRETRQEQVSGMSRRLKQLARELNVPVIALAQLNRSADDHEPKLSHLRESGALEQDADTVILMHRTDATSVTGVVVDLIIAKQRNGPVGRIPVVMQKASFRFDSYDHKPHW